MLRPRCFVWYFGSSLLVLPAAVLASGRLYVGTDLGVFPQVKSFDFPGRLETASFMPYGTSFTGGVRVAAGDVNGDSVADIITGAGPGAGPHVKVFSGNNNTEVRSFFPFSPTFQGGVYVAGGDITGDGVADIIVGAGDGAGPQVAAFDGVTLTPLLSFLAYDPGFTGGVRVAVGDVNGDGTSEIITAAGPGGGPHIKVFSGSTGALDRSLFPFNTSFTGGVYVATGDINGDGIDDIVAGTDTGASQVSLFSGEDFSSLGSFQPFGTSFTGGVRVAVGDITGDGRAELITGSGPGAGHLQIFNGGNLQLLDSFFPFGTSYTGGIFVAAVPEPVGALAVLTTLCLARRRLRA